MCKFNSAVRSMKTNCFDFWLTTNESPCCSWRGYSFFNSMLYTILDQNPELQDVQESFYQAHMAGDSETKELIHGQYFLETAGALKNHVDSMLLRLDELQQKTAGVSEIEHPRIPIIRRHNDFVKETFVKVKAGLDPMVTEETERRMAEAQMY